MFFNLIKSICIAGNFMNESLKRPSIEQVKQTVTNSRRRRHELELACLQLEDLILKLEAENLQRRKQQLSRLLNPFEKN